MYIEHLARASCGAEWIRLTVLLHLEAIVRTSVQVTRLQVAMDVLRGR